MSSSAKGNKQNSRRMSLPLTELGKIKGGVRSGAGDLSGSPRGSPAL